MGNDFMDNKDNIISLVNELLNSNRIWNDTKDYKIDENTKISELRHIWLMDKLLTDLRCGFDSKKILMKIKKVLDEKPLKMCDKDELEEEYIYLINDEMKPEMEEGTPLNNFKLESIEKNVKDFGEGYYDKELNDILIKLLDDFQEKYLRKLNNTDRKD